MFYRACSTLTRLARPEGLRLPRLEGEGLRQAQAAREACDFPGALQTMSLSDRLATPEAYLSLQQNRRRCLEALLPFAEDAVTAGRAVDLICAICEESRWSANPSAAHFDDESHPDIDFQSAETGMLLGWTVRLMGNSLSSRVIGKIRYEVRHRLFSPILAHEDYPFMRGRGGRPLTILSDILLSALLLEQNEQRRGQVLKEVTRLLDLVIGERAERAEALADAAADTGAVTDAAVLLRGMSGGRVDLTPDYPTPGWLDQLLFPWLAGDCFCDPVGGDMKARVSGAELFRIAQVAQDTALGNLGAALHRTRPLPSATVTGRLMDAGSFDALAASDSRPPRIKCAATPRSRVMVSRFSGMICALHTGGGRSNAGGFVLLSGEAPILVEGEDYGNLPIIGSRKQLSTPDLACEAELNLRDDRDTLSVELTHAWPAGLCHSCQRTAIVQRRDQTLRLVDAFDLAEPAVITFQFHTPEVPEPLENGLRLGQVSFTWEDPLTLALEPLPGVEGVMRISLTTRSAVTRSFFTFNFARM